MTREELREKVARAIAAVEANGPATDWEIWLPEADAALAAVREALREPSEAMQRAGRMREIIPNGGAITMWASNRWADMLAASPLADPRA